jgi:phospholipid-binding lipoprotein MlaA
MTLIRIAIVCVLGLAALSHSQQALALTGTGEPHRPELGMTMVAQATGGIAQGDADRQEPEDEFGDEFADEFSEYYEADELAQAPSVSDPLEGFNRAMFWFNDYFYFYAAKPVARTWEAVLPQPLRRGISNAFYNLRFPIRFVNSLLQGKPGRAAQETGRFLLNSTFGLGGLVNVAKGVDLDPPEEDLGQTLGVWGIGQGFFLYLPFLGPSSARDLVGNTGDYFLDPLTWLFWDFGDEDKQLKEWSDSERLWVPLAIRAGDNVNELSFRLGDYEALKKASLDPYAAIRDIYIQARQNQVKQ